MVIDTVAFLLFDTLPAASLTQAYKVLLPAAEVACDVGAVVDHPAAEAAGVVAVSVTIYPVTATLSVAVKRVIGTLREAAVEGIANPVTVGAV